MTTPRFCVSHSVRTAASLYMSDGDGDFTASVAAGLYWLDPVYSGHSVAIDLAYAAAAAIATAAAGVGGTGTLSATYSDVDSNGFQSLTWTEAGGGLGGSPDDTRHTPASSNSEGVRIFKRFGWDPVRSDQVIIESSPGPVGYVQGIWTPDHDVASIQYGHPTGGINAVAVSYNRFAYPFSIDGSGNEWPVQFNSLDQALVLERGGSFPGGTYPSLNDKSLQWHMWRNRSELIRYYSDDSAVITYVTAAVTAAASSISVQSGTGLSNGDIIWVDGERMLIYTGGGTTTLQVWRDNPVAHPQYAPVSDAFCGTYVLASDGGNVNARMFDPAKRYFNATIYDVEMPLIQTQWGV